MHPLPSGFRVSTMTPIGTGATADVFAWGDGRVLKLFHAGLDPVLAEREFAVTRAVHRAGVPAPAVHELVQVEGRPGIVLERVDGPSLLQHFERRPWALFSGARLLADVQARLHACEAPAGLPRQVDVVRQRLAGAGLDPEAAARLPQGNVLCHGDFHPGNVVLSARGPVVLDWSTASAGHPLGDVAFTARLFRNAPLPATTPAPARLLFGVLRRLLERRWLARYRELRPHPEPELAAWLAVVGALPLQFV